MKRQKLFEYPSDQKVSEEAIVNDEGMYVHDYFVLGRIISSFLCLKLLIFTYPVEYYLNFFH